MTELEALLTNTLVKAGLGGVALALVIWLGRMVWSRDRAIVARDGANAEDAESRAALLKAAREAIARQTEDARTIARLEVEHAHLMELVTRLHKARERARELPKLEAARSLEQEVDTAFVELEEMMQDSSR